MKRQLTQMLLHEDPTKVAQYIMNALEADVAAAQARIAKVDDQPVPPRMFIRMDGYRKGQKHIVIPIWVSGVSFADGDGYKITKVSYTDKPLRAKQFNATVGLAIARQLAGSFNMRNVTMESK